MRASDLLRIVEDHVQKFGDTDVILQKDAEGNGYCPLGGGDQELWWPNPECAWEGEIYTENDDPDWVDDPELDAAPEDAYPVLLLWPIN